MERTVCADRSCKIKEHKHSFNMSQSELTKHYSSKKEGIKKAMSKAKEGQRGKYPA